MPALGASFLEEVRRLGRLPRMFNDPRSEEDNAEHRLADRFRHLKHWLLPTTLLSLEAIVASQEIDPVEDMAAEPARLFKPRLTCHLLSLFAWLAF